MEETVIKFEGVSKKFCKNLRKSMHYGLKDVAKNVFGIPAKTDILREEEFWALNNVSFEVKKGETLGIIGPNGAGKTTILKLIAGILFPDKGRIETKGKVSSLIEIGAGFHPMLTGRENIYVNGSILGMKRKEIDEKIDSIIKFADIGNFIDSPVKYYSSGMYVRLGFSIAVHSEPDILLVDEVLAVGDYDFQYKCIHRMEQLKSSGITIVLISHNMTLVRGFCDRVVVLMHGQVKNEGTPEEMIKKYYLYSQTKPPGKKGDSFLTTVPVTGEVEIIEAKFMSDGNREKEVFFSGELSILSIKIKFNRDVEGVTVGFQFFNSRGFNVYGINTNWLDSKFLKEKYPSGTIMYVKFRQTLYLKPDIYSITIGIANPSGTIFYDWKDSLLKFRIVSDTHFEGIANLNSSVEVIKNG